MATAGVVGAALLGVIAVFQLALALGVPAGSMAWGGRRPGVLPGRFRAASAVAGIVLYPLIAWYLLGAAGVVERDVGGPAGAWVLTGFFAIGALANALSRSKPERVWAPISAIIAVCCAVVALGM